MKPLKLVLLCAAVAIFGAMALAKLPHTLYGKRIAGQVVDADTGQPIPGVHVAYLWESGINPSGFTGHNSRTICFHAATAVTDEHGRFEVPAWRKWSTYDVDNRDPNGLIYVRGYDPRQIVLVDGPITPPTERASERYALKRFSGTSSERLDAMWSGIANRGCMYGGDSQKTLFPMLNAMYEEARSLAGASDQVGHVHSFAMQAAYAALALDPNGPAEDGRVNSFIQEHLK